MSAPASERRVLFVCTHNAGRSIVAAALLNAQQPPGVRADSAGTDPADALNPTVVNALAERGISVTGIRPKPITSDLMAAADLVVTMGRHATGPTLPGTAAHQQHWQLDFPGDDLGAMRTLCDQVDGRVQALLADLPSPSDPTSNTPHSCSQTGSHSGWPCLLQDIADPTLAWREASIETPSWCRGCMSCWWVRPDFPQGSLPWRLRGRLVT